MAAGADLFDLFWESSTLNAHTAPAFSRRIEEHSRTARSSETALRYASPDAILPRPRDALAKTMLARRSVRGFSTRPVTLRQLGSLFAAFASSRPGSRTYASAGATYPLEVYCLVERCEALARSVVYYNPDNHSLARVADLPPWEEYVHAVGGLELIGAPPQLVFVFVLVPERTTPKYGERGGRFQLIEVGHASQNLALRLVQEDMAGCEIGSLYDARIAALLGLAGTTARVALGYACGHPMRKRVWSRRG